MAVKITMGSIFIQDTDLDLMGITWEPIGYTDGDLLFFWTLMMAKNSFYFEMQQVRVKWMRMDRQP